MQSLYIYYKYKHSVLPKKLLIGLFVNLDPKTGQANDFCLDHWTSHVVNCVICLSDSLIVRECHAHLCKHVKMFILRAYANEEKRSQDMSGMIIRRFFQSKNFLNYNYCKKIYDNIGRCSTLK